MEQAIGSFNDHRMPFEWNVDSLVTSCKARLTATGSPIERQLRAQPANVTLGVLERLMVQIVEDQPPLVRFGLFEVDLHTGEIRKSGRKVNLQEQPFQVLTMLLERPGEMVTREELQEKLWPSETVDFDSGLNKSIKKIREALGDSAENPRFVETLPRRGYRFIAGIERIEPFAQMPSNSPHNIEVAAAQLHPFPKPNHKRLAQRG